MAFYAQLLLCVLATMTIVQAQQLPSSILCAPSTAPPITSEDCKKAISKFPSESDVLFWNGNDYYRSCGTCRVAITKPSIAHPRYDAAVLSYVATAVHEGLSKCQGKPTNATIGNSQPISVLLDIGHGEKC